MVRPSEIGPFKRSDDETRYSFQASKVKYNTLLFALSTTLHVMLKASVVFPMPGDEAVMAKAPEKTSIS